MGALQDLILQANREFSAEYPVKEIIGISNHLPMCLLALDKIGAQDERLKEFYGKYATRLAPRKLLEE